MSYTSCEGSALLPAVLPPANSTHALGSIIVPTISVSAVASGATLQTITATTLPKGRWLIGGILAFDASVGGQSINGNLNIQLNGIDFWRWSLFAPIADGISVSLSCFVDSDGTTVVTKPAILNTSAGATYVASASPASKVQIVRIA